MISRASWFFGCSAVLLASVLGGCHESSAAQPTSVAPSLSGAPLQNTASNVPSAPASSATNEPASTRAPAASAAPEGGAHLPSGAVTVAVNAGASPEPAADTEPKADAPPVVDAQGKALAQTDERPTLSSVSFQRRIAAVAQAIISGDAEPASSAFFPLVAYQQVKDVAKPERDYRFRLLANFKRDVLEYHKALGAAAAQAKFEGVSVSEQDAKWMAPGSEGNKVGYFRVLRSRLHFTLPTGRKRDFELTSLISWRGEWYVVHLHGFK